MRTRLVAMGVSALAAFACLADGTASLSLSTNYTASAATSLTVTGVGLEKQSSIWVAWDDADQGTSTNGWANVQFVGAVKPAAPSVDWPVPAGWGDDGKKALRFFLCEVPGDVECTLTSMEAAGGNKASPYLITDKTLTGAAKVEMDCTLKDASGTKGLFCSRGSGTTKNQFTLFALIGSRWRFDYNTKTGTNVEYDETAKPVAGTDYSIVVSSAGLYVNDKKAQDCSTAAWKGTCDGPLTIFAYHGGTPGSPTGTSQMILRSFKVTDAAFSLDLVPARQNGVVGVLDLVSGKFIGPSGTGVFTPGDRVEAADPFLFATEVVGELPNVEGKVLFKSDADISDSADHAGGIPGEKVGSGLLTLTGANDFGGTFTVSGGALAADFGQGLGANDNLTLTLGCYAGWNGSVTAALGTGPGQINLAGGAVGFTAAKGDLTVNLGGTGAEVVAGTLGAVASPLVLNDARGAYDLTLLNPFTCPAAITVNNEAGRTFMKGDVNVTGQLAKRGKGRLVFADNAVNVDCFDIIADGGTEPVVTFSNAAVRATTTDAASLMVREGCVELANGASFAADKAIYVGYGDYGRSVATRLVIRDSSLNIGGNWIFLQTHDPDDSIVRCFVYGDSTVKIGRFNVSRGEVQVYGGEVLTSDTTAGVVLGSSSEACRLYGGVLETKAVQCNGVYAAFEWRGGTVRARETVSSFFSRLCAKTRVGTEGGVFDSQNYRVSITNALTPASGQKATAYSRATAMSVPAFRKDGSGALAFSKVNTYLCATDAHEGELKIKEDGALPVDGLLRLTGGLFNENELDRTIGNLVGHGTIGGGGTLTVSGEIVPMGGNLKVTDTKLVGKVCLPVETDGTVTSVLESGGALDLSGIDLSLENAGNLPECGSVRLVAGKTSGSFKSVTGLPDGWRVAVGAKGISITNKGLLVIVR